MHSNDAMPEQPATPELWYASMLPAVFMSLSLHDAAETHVAEASAGIGALAAANHRFADGEDAVATAILQRVWQDGSEEPRVRLWAANALRSRDITVSGPGSDIVLGVVFQVPVDGGIDTVAAYEDGAFRYYNAVRGGLLIEPGAEPTVNAGAKELVCLASGLRPQTPTPDRPTISVLTPAKSIVGGDDDAAGQAISRKALRTVTYAMSLGAPQ
jgi:hypothetical protein